MIPVYVVVEGYTESGFVKHVIAPHLESFGIWTTPIEVTTRRERDGRKHRGGGDWTKWEADIRLLCRDGRSEMRITTLFDLYGLPKNFPELAMYAAVQDTVERVRLLETAMQKRINDARFIPYLQRHEFEALVLASLPALLTVLEDPRDRHGLQKLIEDLGALKPEDVNDSPETAPSKRLGKYIPSYNPDDRAKGEGKSIYGQLATEECGLAKLRKQCPRLDSWVTRLEALGAAQR